jgi:hypothetical protein
VGRARHWSSSCDPPCSKCAAAPLTLNRPPAECTYIQPTTTPNRGQPRRRGEQPLTVVLTGSNACTSRSVASGANHASSMSCTLWWNAVILHSRSLRTLRRYP